jgi:Winged helix DNA-binding domain
MRGSTAPATPRDLARRRLVNQQIAAPTGKTVAEVVASLGAVQAQDYLGSLWALGLRLPGATEAGIERAIADRAILRTWPLRGTLHLVAAADARWMCELLAPRIILRSRTRHQELGLDEATFSRSKDLFLAALQGDRQLTRDAMFERLEAGGISAAGQRGIHILARLALEGVLCFASRLGKQQAFALLDEWAPASRRLDRDAALGEIARRYFTGHGPATLADFTWWSGLAAADAKKGLEAAQPELVQETIQGRAYWMSTRSPAAPDKTGVYLLPGFDEYLIAYKDRTAVLAEEHATKIVPGGNGMFLPMIVREGRVIGTWKRTLKKKTVEVTPAPFEPVSKADARAIEAKAVEYGRFLGLEAVVRWDGAG